MDKRLERILPSVQKPARYTGGEYNEIIKDKSAVKLRMAFCFPDVYEIGMSNLGMRILYGCINAEPDIWCERVFAPWGDMAEKMREHNIPLYALESGDPVSDFDVLGFSLGYEMAYCTVLDMLDMSGIPLRSADRPDLVPLVFAGGTSCCNPEPMAPFLDLMVLGEGEEVDIEVLRLFQKARDEGWEKRRFLVEAARIQGVYVPSLYEPSWNADGTLRELRPLEGAPEVVTKRIISNLDKSYYPTAPIVPSTEIVHDRVNVELFRGCVRDAYQKPIRSTVTAAPTAEPTPTPPAYVQSTYLTELDALRCDNVDIENRYDIEANTGNAYGHALSGESPYSEVIYNLSGNYDQLDAVWFICSNYKNTDNDQGLEIYADNVCVYTAPAITRGSLPVNVSVDITGCKTFEELPENAQRYVEYLEKITGVPVSIIAVGPDRDQTIMRGW